MFDTATLTISGNVVADPKITGVSDNPDRVAFRVISNRRRRDPETGEWKNVGEYGMNVVCWRKLARGVARTIHKGDPVLVMGRISDRKFQGTGGEDHWFTEVTADFVGLDLGQGIGGRFTRFTQLDRLANGSPDSSAGTITASDSASGGDHVASQGGPGASWHDGDGDAEAPSDGDGFGDHVEEVFGDSTAQPAMA